jgi:hypothetical protein
MTERKISVSMAFDNETEETRFVDSAEKLPRRLQMISLTTKPMSLDQLKALVYDCERKHRQDCVVDVDGWFYSSRHARDLWKGLFNRQLFVPDSPAN